MRTTILALLLLFTGSLYAQMGTPLPDFEVDKVDGSKVRGSQMPANIPLVVFYFDPDCDHCNQQAQWISERINEFNGTVMLWVSWGEPEAIRQFADQHFPDYERRPNLIFTKDTKYQFDNWFGYSEVPSIYIYGRKGHRVAEFKTETPVDDLLRYLR